MELFWTWEFRLISWIRLLELDFCWRCTAELYVVRLFQQFFLEFQEIPTPLQQQKMDC